MVPSPTWGFQVEEPTLALPGPFMKRCSLIFLLLSLLICPGFLQGAGLDSEPTSPLAEALEQPSWVFINDSQSPWTAQTSTSHDGDSAGRSGTFTGNGASQIQTTVEGPGTLSFWWRVSSEEDFDFLQFSINDALQMEISGEQPWSEVSFPLGAGANTLTWSYAKDELLDEGEDAGWLDQIRFTPDDPMQVLPEAPWEITSYVSAPVSTHAIYSIHNHGEEALNWNVSSTVDWLDFAGMAADGDVTELTVATNSRVAEQPVGTYEGELTFNNVETGAEQIREVTLTVLPDPGNVEVFDSIHPTDDRSLPFGNVSLGVTSTATVRIHNSDPEQPLRIDRIQLRRAGTETAPETETSPTFTFVQTNATTTSSPTNVATSQTPPPSASSPDWTRAHDPATILVRFKHQATSRARASVRQNLGGRVVSRSGKLPLEVIEVPAGSNPKALLAAYAKDPSVAYAEPNYKVSIRRTPNDPRFPEQWSLNNTGQQGGLPGADISAIEAANITRGSHEIIVAVIDTGIDYKHPDLAANMWVNPDPTFGDIHGATWTRGDGTVTNANPMDNNDHGTHCAGIIGAVGNNGIGIAGVNWNVRLMALKFLDQNGDGYVADAVAALEYAIDHGAHITNNSWGGGESSQALAEMIAVAGDANQLFVAAAGNDAADNDLVPSYPASHELDNIISVANSDRNDGRGFLSNYGKTTVDLAAPGEDILSTVVGGGYEIHSGTSMAAPHVTGVAALMLSLNPEATYTELKETILETVTPLPAWQGVVASGGRLNAAAALSNVFQTFQLSNIPDLPFTLEPGRTILVEVAYAPLSTGSHEAIVLIESDDLTDPVIEVELNGVGVVDPLEVVEQEDLIAEGLVSSPVDPLQKVYTLRNNSNSEPVSWSAAATAAWITVTPRNGTLPAGTESTVTVSINDEALALSDGLHSGTVRFTNPVTTAAVERLVQLRLNPLPGALVVTDSIGPTDDQTLPFGYVYPGEARAESVTLTNTHATHDLILEDILLLGGFREDFNASSPANWDQRPAQTWSVEEGQYIASSPDATGMMQSTYTGELWFDGTVKTQIARQGSDTAASVLILRASSDFNLEQDKGSALAIGISWNGSYYIIRYINGLMTWIQPWTGSPALLTSPQASNSLTASLHGDQLHVFINDQLAWSGQAEGLLQPGRVGVAGFSKTSDPSTHRFAFLEVDAPLPLEPLPLGLSQSWSNANPSSHADPAFLPAPIALEPPPAGKSSELESARYSELNVPGETFTFSGDTDFPRTLAPGETLPVPVAFTPSGEGKFSRTLRILSNDPTLSSVDLALSGESEKDALHISPAGPLTLVGSTGGPFTPSEMTYTLRNSGETALTWRIVHQPEWIEIDQMEGSLPAGAVADFMVSLHDTASALGPQLLSGEIQIMNTESEFIRAIPVILDIRPTLCEALDACDLVWTSSSGSPWTGQDEVVFSDGASARSGRISNRETSSVQTVVQGPGVGSFWWMVSSEPEFDQLEFRVNGVQQTAISGEVGWTRVTFEVPEGEHTLRWIYGKDFFFESGADAGWLDNVEWTPVDPTYVLVAEDSLAFGVVPVGQTSSRTLSLRNEGNSTLTIEDITSPEGFSYKPNIDSIPPGGEADLVITFAPRAAGDYSGPLTITSDAGTHTIQLIGIASADEPLEMANGESISAFHGSTGSAQPFYIDVPPGRAWLEISLSGGTGDADLYVREGEPASLTVWDYAPRLVGNNETVRIERPVGGPWFFLVHGYSYFSGATLRVNVAPITLQDWADEIGLSAEERTLSYTHSPLGVTTLEGYAFGRDPRNFAPKDLPYLEPSSENPSQIHLIYRVQADASDLTMGLQTSPDLLEWKAASPVSESVLSEIDGIEVRRATFETDSVESLFLRANIRYTAP